MDILGTLDYSFFLFAYGINIMLPLLAFILYVKQGRQWIDAALAVFAYVVFVTIVVLTFSKAPIAIYTFLALATFIAIRAPLRVAVPMLVVSAAIFVLVNAAFSQPTSEAPPARPAESASVQPAPAEATAAPSPVATPAPSGSPYRPKPDSLIGTLWLRGQLFAESYVNRMAVAHPFHVAIFSDPKERCGIQGSQLRKVLGIGPPECVLTEKAFRLMFPEVDWTKGFQPVSASLSAYAELGWVWSIAVMILSGITLGLFGSLASASPGPLGAAFCVAACGFAYDLTQVPFVASFTYPHGLFAFLIAVVVAALPGLLLRGLPRVKIGNADVARRN